jgi:Tol biopolymer transport system component
MARATGWQSIVWTAVIWATAIGVCDAQPIPATRVSVDATATQVAGASRQPSSSADGRFVAFSSTATTLVADDSNGSADVFVKDRQTGAVTRVSVRTDGTQQMGNSVEPDISADGRYVAFASPAQLAAEDNNSCSSISSPTCTDIYVHDRTTGATTRVSVATGGAQAGAISRSPRISGDGRYVVFESFASNLVAGDTNAAMDIFLHDRQTATTTRVSVASNGAQSDRQALSPTISDDGSRIAFLSDATTLDASADALPCVPASRPCTRAFVRNSCGTSPGRRPAWRSPPRRPRRPARCRARSFPATGTRSRRCATA